MLLSHLCSPELIRVQIFRVLSRSMVRFMNRCSACTFRSAICIAALADASVNPGVVKSLGSGVCSPKTYWFQTCSTYASNLLRASTFTTSTSTGVFTTNLAPSRGMDFSMAAYSEILSSDMPWNFQISVGPACL